MTIPYERYRAVNNTRTFLLSLLDPKKTPRISKSLRREALYLLKHYPSEFDMEIICRREEELDKNNISNNLPLYMKIFEDKF